MPHSDGSPYQCLSAHAGNPAFIDIQWLKDKGWLKTTEQTTDCLIDTFAKSCLIAKVFCEFQALANIEDKKSFELFCQDNASWLDDFSLFVALRQEYDNQCWNQWPEAIKNRKPTAIKKAQNRLKSLIESTKV